MGGRAHPHSEFPTWEDNYIESGRESTEIDLEGDVGGVERYVFRLESPGAQRVFRTKNGGCLNNAANHRFLVKAYKKTHCQSSHVVVMYNGLDETVHTMKSPAELFAFYDEIGARLAADGALAILLPTPYHMNRALCYTTGDAARRKKLALGKDWIDIHRPSDALIRSPENIFRNHFQGLRETVSLLSCIRSVPPYWEHLAGHISVMSPRVSRTIGSWVTPDAKVSVLGYSLGGLRALTEFIADRFEARRADVEPLFTGCVAVCSGGNISELRAPFWIDQDKWSEMVDKLSTDDTYRNEVRGECAGLMQETCNDYLNVLNDVFLGRAAYVKKIEDLDAASSMLFLIGGSDQVFSLDSLKRMDPKGGVSIYQVSGLGHLFSYDPAWINRKTEICGTISSFLETTARMRIQPDPSDLLLCVVCLTIRLDLFPYRSRIDRESILCAIDRISEIGDIMKGISSEAMGDLPDSEEIFSAAVREVLHEFDLAIRRRVVNPASFWPKFDELFLGGVFKRNPSLSRQARSVTDEGELAQVLLDQRLLAEGRFEQFCQDQERAMKPHAIPVLRFIMGYAQRRGEVEPRATPPKQAEDSVDGEQ